MPPTPDLTFGDIADAIDVARRTHPHLGWVIVPAEQLPNGRYQICPEQQMLYLARSLAPEDGFAAWMEALREITGVAAPTAQVIPLHYPCPQPDGGDCTG